MRAFFSAEVTERHGVFQSVKGLFDTFQGVLVEKLQKKIWPVPAGGQVLEEGREPFFLAPISGLTRLLGDTDHSLVEKDDEIRLAAAEELTLREERNQLSRKALDRMIGFRNAVLGLFVHPNVDALGLQAFTDQRPVWILRRGQGIIKALTSSQLVKMLGERLFDDEAGLFDRLAEQLRASVRALAESQRQVTHARRKVQILRAERNRLHDAYNVLFLRTSRIFEDLCHIVGEKELAERLRPTTRSTSKGGGDTIEVAADVDSDSSSGSDGDTSGSSGINHSHATSSDSEPVEDIVSEEEEPEMSDEELEELLDETS